MSKLLCYQNVENQRINPKFQSSLRIMSYNVHGFKNRSFIVKIQGIVSAIAKINPDVLVLQEIYLYKKDDTLTQKNLIDLLTKIGFEYFAFSESGTNSVCSKFPFECKSIDLINDPIHKLPRNAMICNFPHFPDLILVGTHLDPYDESGITRQKQMEQIYHGLNIHVNKHKQIVIMGDFNSLRRADYNPDEWNEILLTGQKRNIKPIEDVIPWLESRGFIDSFDQTKKKISVSVWAERRVDYIIGLNIQFVHSDVLKTTASDHYPIFADVIF